MRLECLTQLPCANATSGSPRGVCEAHRSSFDLEARVLNDKGRHPSPAIALLRGRFGICDALYLKRASEVTPDKGSRPRSRNRTYDVQTADVATTNHRPVMGSDEPRLAP